VPVRFDLTTLLVEDVARTVAFYDAALGFAVRSERGEYVELVAGGARLAVYPRASFAALTDEPVRVGVSVTLGMHCDDRAEVDASFAHAVAHGARAVRAPAVTPWLRYAAFIADPDDHVIELSSPV